MRTDDVPDVLNQITAKVLSFAKSTDKVDVIKHLTALQEEKYKAKVSGLMGKVYNPPKPTPEITLAALLAKMTTNNLNAFCKKQQCNQKKLLTQIVDKVKTIKNNGKLKKILSQVVHDGPGDDQLRKAWIKTTFPKKEAAAGTGDAAGATPTATGTATLKEPEDKKFIESAFSKIDVTQFAPGDDSLDKIWREFYRDNNDNRADNKSILIEQLNKLTKIKGQTKALALAITAKLDELNREKDDNDDDDDDGGGFLDDGVEYGNDPQFNQRRRQESALNATARRYARLLKSYNASATVKDFYQSLLNPEQVHMSRVNSLQPLLSCDGPLRSMAERGLKLAGNDLQVLRQSKPQIKGMQYQTLCALFGPW